jgi:hypothetical protein
MSRGAALIRFDDRAGDRPKPIAARELGIASLARKAPGPALPAGRHARTVIRLKVALARNELGLHHQQDYFQLKLKLARTLRRKLRVAIVEVDDCTQSPGTGDPFDLSLDPPDEKRLARLRAAVRRLLRAQPTPP